MSESNKAEVGACEFSHALFGWLKRHLRSSRMVRPWNDRAASMYSVRSTNFSGLDLQSHESTDILLESKIYRRISVDVLDEGDKNRDH